MKKELSEYFFGTSSSEFIDHFYNRSLEYMVNQYALSDILDDCYSSRITIAYGKWIPNVILGIGIGMLAKDYLFSNECLDRCIIYIIASEASRAILSQVIAKDRREKQEIANNGYVKYINKHSEDKQPVNETDDNADWWKDK